MFPSRNQRVTNDSSMKPVQTEMIAQLEVSLCNGCHLCLPACNSNALLWVRGDGELLLDPWACTGCGTCVSTCPTDALSLEPRGTV